MDKILKIGMNFPRLTLLDIRILALLDEQPGRSIRETADILNEDYRTVQERISILSAGRKRRNGRSCYHLLTVERSFRDRRERSLALTPAGDELINKLKGTEQ